MVVQAIRIQQTVGGRLADPVPHAGRRHPSSQRGEAGGPNPHRRGPHVGLRPGLPCTRSCSCMMKRHEPELHPSRCSRAPGSSSLSGAELSVVSGCPRFSAWSRSTSDESRPCYVARRPCGALRAPASSCPLRCRHVAPDFGQVLREGASTSPATASSAWPSRSLTRLARRASPGRRQPGGAAGGRATYLANVDRQLAQAGLREQAAGRRTAGHPSWRPAGALLFLSPFCCRPGRRWCPAAGSVWLLFPAMGFMRGRPPA